VNYEFLDEVKPEQVPGIVAEYRGKSQAEGTATDA
jgi:hypothetical protein